MVRIKRIRKRKIILLAAAGVFTVAVLVLLILFSVSALFRMVKGNTDSVSPVAEESADTLDKGLPGDPAEKQGGEPPEDPMEKSGEEAPAEEKLPVSGNSPGDNEGEESPPEVIDDDSMQDMNSVVESEMEDNDSVKKVYLTFDDGPSIYTDEILDILKEYGVKATFFVCGTGDSDPGLRHIYKRIVDEGHAIGMHSYSHVYSRVYGDLDLFQYDLDKIRNLIYNETGVVPKYYRFPGGSGNTIASIPMDRYISVLYSQGMEYYDWNVYGGDSSGNSLSPSKIAENTLNGVDRRDTAVILLHDTGSRRNTVLALPDIIEGLKDRGLDLSPIDDDTPPLHQFDEANAKR